ncbi:dipeptidylpeptidase [Lobosporangium transversale]|uniref:Peptidase S9 prolyl oligopeptidase catalytic domain-containing protein n=1 Tax=Lobosporangium transversale TaxID=64571 RepID=A0A1Y2GMA4_9FUNG|nr:hypothetical protein BCR41DRAFT_387181 [Lobosporangium transversale]KAF9905525.1 dipeptidylpeptidase [Lobosporangium transversale]ORZ13343.1 hypothetical protein BCR41DRAFT_387181 [Lobosporangium transversale]|eukprot:XP_021880424.1 hypothetical protein BCR41DRAFT_387181 [Lobosporangium transversale]
MASFSWDQIRNEVRSFRALVQPTVVTICDVVFDPTRDRIYFLASDLSRSFKSPMLFRVDLPPSYSTLSSYSPEVGKTEDDMESHIDTDTDTYIYTDTETETDTAADSDTDINTNNSTIQVSILTGPEAAQHSHSSYRHISQSHDCRCHDHQQCQCQSQPQSQSRPRHTRYRRRRRHGHNDHDMDLIPFNPDSYQGFASLAPPIHIFISPRTEPIQAAIGSSSTSTSCASSVGANGSANQRYPHNAYTPDVSLEASTATDQILAAAPVLDWTPVLTEEWLKYASTCWGHSPCDRLSSFQFEPQVNRLMFSFGTVIYTGDVQEDGKVNPQPAQSDPHPSTDSPSLNRTYSNMVHNALTAGLNLVSVSGPLTSPRASLSGYGSTPTSTSTSASASPSHLDKSGAGSTGTRADPRLGGSAMDLIAFTRDQDIWVSTMTGVETQLTFCSRNTKKSDISCGIAEFVMQEEFHRSTNYYWAPPPPQSKSRRRPQTQIHMQTNTQADMQPCMHMHSDHPSSISQDIDALPVSIANNASCRTTEKILYLQVSEAMVDLVVIPRQGMHPSCEEYRYPHAGTPNAVSDLQIVEFVPKRFEKDEVPEPLHKRLWGRASLYKLFPWLEYIVRFGWMPDGGSVWVQILDRRQQVTAIIVIPLECFMSVAEKSDSSEEIEDKLASRIRVIHEEQSKYWINVTDIIHILPSEHHITDNHSMGAQSEEGALIQFIIPSERTGYRHLYLVTHSFKFGSTVRPITAGQFQVVDKQITVDPSRQLVYFTAKRDSVLETHLYVASYARSARPENMKRLTELGYSHQAIVDVEKDRFLTMYSSMDQSPACAVIHLRWNDCRLTEPASPSTSIGKNYGNNHTEKICWCDCGCHFPKISSHAYLIKQGIINQNAERIRRAPVVASSCRQQQGHTRSFSESFVKPFTSSPSPRMDSALDGFKAGPMSSVSGFLANHSLSSSLPKMFTQHHHQRRNHCDSSMVVSSTDDSHNTEGSSSTGTRLPNFKFISAIRSSPSFSKAPSLSPFSSSRSSPSSSADSSSGSSLINATHHPVGEFFSFMSSDNIKLHGCLYRPANYIEGQRYPTLVCIYGGPRSQMVLNEYKLPRFLRVFLAASLGHAVVMIDGRGSNDRGLEFEGRLRHQMGLVEIRDQVEGLEFLARPENGGIVDMNRVAISGWSYGGYLSLMALVQYPHIFKLSIAGAPVTQWELYNSAYTERYMGLVHENKDGYAKSNILNWVDKFPDSENRLLIAHGLIDENVHVKNTETLVEALVRNNKPHQTQFYPTERHGLRDSRTNEQFETLLLYWLKNYL